MAPTTAMASSALVSDINGVCKSGETRRMTSKPMKPANMKRKGWSADPSSFLFFLLDLRCKRCERKEFTHSGIDNFSPLRQQRVSDDFILPVELYLPILHEVQKKRRYVPCVQLAGV